MATFAQQAVARVHEYMRDNSFDRPADLLADLIHYCDAYEIDLLDELAHARGYVDEELGVDQDLR